jgi:hypothetical protein
MSFARQFSRNIRFIAFSSHGFPVFQCIRIVFIRLVAVRH